MIVKPFVILALPRTGTKMLVSALGSHPDMPKIIHEFRGDYHDYLKHPYVLSNTIESWMKPPIKIMHVGRESAIAGALSMIKMAYRFPDGSFDIPVEEVRKVAEFRREAESRMRKIAQWSITYESMTLGKDVREIYNSVEICEFFGVKPRALMPTTETVREMRASNEDELWAA